MYTKSYNVSTATRATEQYFPVVLFIMLYKVVLTFESVDENLFATVQTKATEHCVPLVYFAKQGGSIFWVYHVFSEKIYWIDFTALITNTHATSIIFISSDLKNVRLGGNKLKSSILSSVVSLVFTFRDISVRDLKFWKCVKNSIYWWLVHFAVVGIKPDEKMKWN